MALPFLNQVKRTSEKISLIFVEICEMVSLGLDQRKFKERAELLYGSQSQERRSTVGIAWE